MPHLRREYHSLLSIVTRGGNITQTLAAASPQETVPLPPVYRHLVEGISLRHWLLPHLRREYHYLLSILTAGREYHSDTDCCLTSGDNTTPSCLSSLGGRNITQTLAAASPHETIILPPAYPHWGREYHSDTGCCLTSGENTTPSCLSSLGEGISLRHWLLPHLRRQYHSLLPILTRGGNITQTLAAASPQETVPLPPVYRHLGEGISLRHWLLPHLRREYHSLLSILTAGREYHSDTDCCLTSGDNTTFSCLSSLGGRNITQTLAAASPQETIILPPAYPHWGREYHSDTGCCLTSEKIPLPPVYRHSGREYHSDTGCCLTSGDNTTPSCLSSLGEGISLRHWLLPHLRRQYHSLLPILTRGGNITQTLAAASPQWSEYHSLLSIVTRTREYHSDTGCCLTSIENTTPSCLSSLRGGNITQTLAAASPQERIPLPPVYPHCGEGISLRHWLLPHLRRQYHSLLSILTRGGNITQTLAAASPQERIPLPPAYPHCGEGISLRHWLLPHLRREYYSLLSIVTRGGNITQTLAAASPQWSEYHSLLSIVTRTREYHSDTGCCLTSIENTTPSCLSSLWQGISLRHWLLPHLKREYHSLLSILTRGREYHSDTGCCLTSIENTTPSCLSSLRGGNITQTLAAASPQETIPLPPVYPHSGWEYHSDTGCCLTSGENTTPSCLSSLRGGNITQTLAAVSPQ